MSKYYKLEWRVKQTFSPWVHIDINISRDKEKKYLLLVLFS